MLMKRFTFLIALILCTFSASAQRLVSGEKAPKLTVSKYIYGGPSDKGKPVLVEFFVSSGNQSLSQIETLSAFADKYRGKIDVVLISRSLVRSSAARLRVSPWLSTPTARASPITEYATCLSPY